MSNEIILRMDHVNKLYGPNKSEAARMMQNGSNKDEVYKQTGCTVALWDVTFDVPEGEIFVVIGLSGSGKSTAVRCFNKLTEPTDGGVYYRDQNVMEMPQKELLEYRRNKISMVFQSFGLMSHRNVMNNVAYSLEVRGMSRDEREKKAIEAISMVGLDGSAYQSCDQLSGGMRQRVGIARALVSDPEILLMDEPFSALDPLVRKDMQFELLQIQRKLKKTIVFITHDIDEAFKMGDTVCIMKDGKVVQIGTPEELTMNPADDYVKEFIESADRSKVATVKNIMITPSSIVKCKESPDRAVRVMRDNNLSSVVVIDNDMQLKGILTLQEALEARGSGKHAEDLCKQIPNVGPDTMVSEIIPMASEAWYPIAVTDEGGGLLGLVTKASILSSLL